ncbi:MAG: metal-dependent transcriptional regulator [Candidatus Bathyarchaeota archaeon]|nr:metal-dependent transcriptional regulator [Candidatus Bathyarchaeota archaeon]MCX8178126.1 metal-dependent transcriptional regulator [Candidatus Bathyarchaeota archaeon]MDW8194427.1 metal-dependent transcriptional regulator [Nitrososphaerota archaeon]
MTAAIELSNEAEEYIEAIYRLQRRRGIAKTKDLARELKVVPGSITNTIAHLKRHGLVEHTPYKGVKLTLEGEKLALNILRRHRLAERLLTDILEAEWSEVHDAACILEHALSDDVLELIERRLSYPKFCPHGNPIPSEKGELNDVECFPLTEASSDQTCIIVGIIDEKREMLVALAEKGVKPQALVHIIKKSGKSLIICVDGKESKLSKGEAENILVKKSGGRN